jgi:Signal peptidase, peptidase S26
MPDNFSPEPHKDSIIPESNLLPSASPPSVSTTDAPVNTKGGMFDTGLRYFLGILLILFVQLTVYIPGFLFNHLLASRGADQIVQVVVGVGCIALLTAIFANVLERGNWLSRFLRLPYNPNKPPIVRSLLWAVAGPLGVLIYVWIATKPSAATPNTRSEPPPVDSTREVVETVVFVIVLVLLLKSFVAEAFVIPTGSMAETLYGYQKIVTCPECGILFAVNCSSEVEGNDGKMDRVEHCMCPNCRKEIGLYMDPKLVLKPGEREPEDPRTPDQIHQGTPPPHYLHLTEGEAGIPDPGWTSGDRVLVAKFLSDLFNTNPDRLGVVVFKYPGQSGTGGAGDLYFPGSGPINKNHVPMNYIKRLIGISGESIAICNGKIYILSAEDSPPYHDLKDELANAKTPAEREQWLAQLWQQRYMHINDDALIALFRKGKFQILRKAPENILAMMRLVYDNDHPARDLKAPEDQRWQSEKEKTWLADEPNGFRHAPGSDDGVSWLRYHHRLRKPDGSGTTNDKRITPFMGYNSTPRDRSGNSAEELSWVGDLILECEVTVDQPQGDFVLELSKGPERFQAQWNLADGFCTLYRVSEGDGPAKLEAGDAKPPVRKELKKTKTALTSGTHRLRFANVDQRLTVWVDGSLVFGEGESYEVAEPPSFTEKNDLEPASIGAKGAKVQVKHVRLLHDTYYSLPQATVGKDPPIMTMYVQPDHFLCMGDNSFHSSDSRSWGLVPRRLMLGKALTVYYPFYFPWWPLSSQVNRIGLIH